MINIAFGVAFSQMRVRVRISTPSAFPDVYDKTAEINAFQNHDSYRLLKFVSD